MSEEIRVGEHILRNEPTDICIGKHVVRTEPPDVFIVEFVGDLSLDEMRRIFAEQKQFEAGKEYILLLSDMSNAGSVSAEARKIIPTESKGTVCRGMAIYGASFHVRVLATLVTTAARLLNKFSNYPTHFFDTEAQAREWLKERRMSILQRTS
jgi:hypothetical protein